jgi:hypothetical protein
MDTLQLNALVAGYAFNVGNNVRQQVLEGGMPRQVIKFLGAVHSVNAQVLLPDERTRQYFWAFWRVNQTRKFYWELSIDNGINEVVVCQFDAETVPAETEIHAIVRKVSFTVFVEPITRNADDDQAVVDIFNGVPDGDVTGIEKIPNIWLPDATGV